MKVYLAGPITGKPLGNFPAFNRMAKTLRVLGYEVVNPAELDNPDGEWSDELLKVPREVYLRRDFKALLDCDAVLLLNGWQYSEGACDERYVAKKAGIPVYYRLPDLIAAELVDASAGLQ